jgi:hypothetical protein
LIIFDEDDEDIEQKEPVNSPEAKEEEYESMNLKKLCQNETNKEFYGIFNIQY